MSDITTSDSRAIQHGPRIAMGLRWFPVRIAITAGVIGLALVACSGSSGSSGTLPLATTGSSIAVATSAGDSSSATAPSEAPAETLPPSDPGPSQEPDTGGGSTSGDVPDNAVFLTYQQAKLGFAIQYVEGWQVTTQPDGVLVKDKDSSETVTVVASPGDVAAYIASTDLPGLQSQAGFKLVKQNSVTVSGTAFHHLVYHILSPADPVTGKQVPSTVDRYYVPGSGKLAIVSLSTPDGVDNVDAFRQMITSFAWK